MGLFEEIQRKGNTIIIVTHEEDIAQHAHRIVRMKDGMIGEDILNHAIRKASEELKHLKPEI